MTESSTQGAVRRGLPVADWPQPDRALWHAALTPGDILEEGGSRARYSPVSNRNFANWYGLWLAWLGDRVNLADAPADRITPEHVRAYASELSGVVAPITVLNHLRAVYEMALVFDQARDWTWIRQVASRIRMHAKPVRQKRDRMVSSRELLLLGQQLMLDAPAQPTPCRRARTYRNGLIISFLATRPLRQRNLAGIELDRTLVRRGTAWWIEIPAEETKTRRPIEVPWPEALTPALEIYLNEHRPLLTKRVGRWTRPVGNALWVSSDGSPMRQRALYDMIVARTVEAFGKPINPHLFRDCAATSIAIEDPVHVRIASQILGHRSVASTERYYNQAQTIDAARRYQDFLIQLRSGKMTEDPEPAEI
jgi:integrase